MIFSYSSYPYLLLEMNRIAFRWKEFGSQPIDEQPDRKCG